ncbi:MAG: OsmC family protein, partial [Prevotella sp.]
MKKETVKATAILKEGTIVEATSGGFKMNFDEPLKSGGTDTAMNPVQGLLCALGSCQALSAYYGAKMYGIELKGFSIDVEGDFDEEGQHGENGVNSGFTDVRITYNFDA